MNILKGGAAKPDCRRHICKLAVHQDHVGRVNRHICPGSDGNSDIGSCQRGSVVDPVSCHSRFPLLLQSADYAFLSVRQYACNHFVHAGQLSDRFGRSLVIARQHYHTDTHILQFTNGFGAFLFHHIRNRNNPRQFSVSAKKQGGLPFFRQSACRTFHGFRNFRFRFYETVVSPQQALSFPYRAQTVSGKNFKITDLFFRQFFFLRLFADGACKGMLALSLQGVCQSEQFLSGYTVRRNQIRHLRFSKRNRTRLIQRYNLYFSGFLQRHRRFK